jgi:GT2 family glycosyltransferase
MSAQPIEVSIIIVHYNTPKDLKKCLISIKKHVAQINYEIIVVDNNSSDRSCEDFPMQFPFVRFFFLNKNLGFGGGNNYGVSHSKGKYIFLLNPDTIFIEDSLQPLFDFIKTQEKVGAVGPKILNHDKTFQKSFGCKLSFTEQIFKMFYLHKLYLFCKYHFNEKRISIKNEPIVVDWITGAALFLSRKMYESVGGFDEKIFLYSEDVDLCIRISELGFDNYYFPNTSIIHLQGTSTNEEPFLLVTSRYQGLLRYTQKHFSLTKNILIRALLITGIIFRLSLIMFIFFYPISERKERFRGYCKALKMCLTEM